MKDHEGQYRCAGSDFHPYEGRKKSPKEEEIHRQLDKEFKKVDRIMYCVVATLGVCFIVGAMIFSWL